jgi:hypothetical protein
MRLSKFNYSCLSFLFLKRRQGNLILKNTSVNQKYSKEPFILFQAGAGSRISDAQLKITHEHTKRFNTLTSTKGETNIAIQRVLFTSNLQRNLIFNPT